MENLTILYLCKCCNKAICVAKQENKTVFICGNGKIYENLEESVKNEELYFLDENTILSYFKNKPILDYNSPKGLLEYFQKNNPEHIISQQHQWDFSQAPGDTIMGKYESLYVELVNITNNMREYNWICTSPEIASIFETATMGFEPITNQEFQSNLRDYPSSSISCKGTINKRWMIFSDEKIDKDSLIIGRSDLSAKLLKIINFII
jgi:hypothetical protein